MSSKRRILAILVLSLWIAACGGASSEAGGVDPACVSDDSCDDGIACTRDRCREGVCQHESEPVACDDGNPCTRDACKPDEGCLNLPDREGLGCDDHDPCTQADVCRSGRCAGTPATCDDGDPCTADACDPVTGACVSPPVADGHPCDDGDPCTEDDACHDGACRGDAFCECLEDADCAAQEDGDACNGTLACLGHVCAVDPPRSSPVTPARTAPVSGPCACASRARVSA